MTLSGKKSLSDHTLKTYASHENIFLKLGFPPRTSPPFLAAEAQVCFWVVVGVVVFLTQILFGKLLTTSEMLWVYLLIIHLKASTLFKN